MTNGDGRQKETLALKVFGGAVMAGPERKKNERSGGQRCGGERWRNGGELNHL